MHKKNREQEMIGRRWLDEIVCKKPSADCEVYFTAYERQLLEYAALIQNGN